MYIQITYYLNSNRGKINTNVKRKQVPDLLEQFLITQVGRGADCQKANERDVYHIQVEVDLSYDKFRVRDDTGNKGLRDGIIMQVAKQESERLEKLAR